MYINIDEKKNKLFLDIYICKYVVLYEFIEKWYV